jgi:hypothetical protein
MITIQLDSVGWAVHPLPAVNGAVGGRLLRFTDSQSGINVVIPLLDAKVVGELRAALSGVTVPTAAPSP